MGLLDDLKNQAENKRQGEESEARRKAETEEFYRLQMLPRMVKAYQFFTEFIETLKYLDQQVTVEYPVLPHGKPQVFEQGDYKVVIDSSKELKNIDLFVSCTLKTPVQFELHGKENVLAHADRISQYSIKHERKDKKGVGMEILSAKFIITGPLPLKMSIQADIEASLIKLIVRNFAVAGYQRYTLNVEQFDDAFLDRLGRFILRQDMNLFDGGEISEEQRQKLRQKMAEEARLREQELAEAEARLKAEEAAAAENTTKEQLKRAMNQTVAQGKENLKGMFNKIKQTAAQLAEQHARNAELKKQKAAELAAQKARQAELDRIQAAQLAEQQARQAGLDRQHAAQLAAQQAQLDRQKAAQHAAQQAALTPQQNTPPPINTPTANVSAPTQAPPAPPMHSEAASTPPKLYQAPEGNPFLKPEDLMTPEQIRQEAERENQLKQQNRLDRIAAKARENDAARQAKQGTPAQTTNPVSAAAAEDKTQQTPVSATKANEAVAAPTPPAKDVTPTVTKTAAAAPAFAPEQTGLSLEANETIAAPTPPAKDVTPTVTKTAAAAPASALEQSGLSLAPEQTPLPATKTNAAVAARAIDEIDTSSLSLAADEVQAAADASGNTDKIKPEPMEKAAVLAVARDDASLLEPNAANTAHLDLGLLEEDQADALPAESPTFAADVQQEPTSVAEEPPPELEISLETDLTIDTDTAGTNNVEPKSTEQADPQATPVATDTSLSIEQELEAIDIIPDALVDDKPQPAAQSKPAMQDSELEEDLTMHLERLMEQSDKSKN